MSAYRYFMAAVLLSVLVLTVGAAESEPALENLLGETPLEAPPKSPPEPSVMSVESQVFGTTSPVQYVSNSFVTVLGSGSRSQAGAVLVIGGGDADEADIAALREDLKVMGRIIDKRLAQAGVAGGHLYDPGQRIPLLSTQGQGDKTEAIYVDGFGVLFVRSVDFPLVAPAEAKEELPGTQDTVWNATKRELAQSNWPAGRDIPTTRRGMQPVLFNAERVWELERVVVKSLVHAANIRALEGSESVAVVIRGPRAVVGGTTTTLYPSQEAMMKDLQARDGELTVLSTSVTSRGCEVTYRARFGGSSVMSISVSRSDIDLWAGGEVTAEEFREKVAVVAY